MDKIILIIVGIFFLVGVFDYIKKNKLGYGKLWLEGIESMGKLAIGMIGILSITPVISDLIIKLIFPITNYLGIDSSIITSTFIAVDMGAYKISQEISSGDMVYFSGILIASILGATLSFTLPLALGLIKEDQVKIMCKGILCGIITAPIGIIVGGLLLNIDIKTILLNLLPVLICTIIISIGLLRKPVLTINIFKSIGKAIVFLGIIGLGIQGFNSITGITLIGGLLPLEECISIVGKIALFLGGAFVMIEFVNRLLKNKIDNISKVIGVNNKSILALFGSLASAIIIFTTFDELDYNGKVICSAFSVAGAYTLGGQLGYVASEAPSISQIYIITKLLCGILAILLAIVVLKREKEVTN